MKKNVVLFLLSVVGLFAQAETVKALTERFDCVLGTVGIHPHNAGEGELPGPEALAALTDHPRIIGLGESGLDYFYDKAPREAQAENFRNHIRAAQITGLPLAIHARQADEDIADILAEERDRGGAFPFLLHCFSSGRGLAERAVLSVLLRHPDLPEKRGIAGDRAGYAGGSAAGGNRCALPRPRALSRQAL